MQYSRWQLALITTHPHYLADQDHLFCLFCNLEGLTGLAGRCFTPLHMAQCEPHGLWRKPGIQARWELTARQVYSRAASSEDTNAALQQLKQAWPSGQRQASASHLSL